jgi:hypothetical protein
MTIIYKFFLKKFPFFSSINPQSANFRQKLGQSDSEKKLMPKLMFKFATNESKNLSKSNVSQLHLDFSFFFPVLKC